MNKIKVYAVYDSKVKAYMQPFFSQSDRDATIAFRVAANDGKSVISTHPQDFSLMALGEFDDSTGRLTPYIPVESLGLAVEHKDVPAEKLPMKGLEAVQ